MNFLRGTFAVFLLALGCISAALWPWSYQHCHRIAYRQGYGSTSLFDSVRFTLILSSQSGRWELVCETNDPHHDRADLGFTTEWDPDWWYSASWSYRQRGDVDSSTRNCWTEDQVLMRVWTCLGCDWGRQEGTHTSEDTIQTDYRRRQEAVPHAYTTVPGLLAGWALGRRWRQNRALRRRRLAGCCAACGYDLRAHQPGQKCPECGTPVPAAAGTS